MPQVRRAQQSESPVVVNVGAQPAPPAHEPEQDKPELPPNWFFDKISVIGPEEWAKAYVVELHRLEPKLPGVPGSKGYLDVYTEPITLAQIKARFGGGKFRLVLMKNSKYVTSYTFDVVGDPIYARGRELPPDGHGTNGDGSTALLQQFVGVLRDELARSRENVPNSATDEAIKLLTSASEKAMDVVVKQIPATANPTAQLESLVTTAKNLGILGGNNGGGVLETVRVLKELGVIGGAATSPQNPLEQLKLFMDIFEKIDALRGDSGGGRRGDWKSVLAEKAAEVLPTVLENMSDTQRRRGAAGQRPQVRQEPARPSVSPNVTPAPPQRVAMPAAVNRVVHPSAAPPPAASFRVVASDESTDDRARTGTSAPVVADQSSGAANTDDATISATVEIMPTEQEIYVTGVKRSIVECMRNGDDGDMIVDYLERAWPEAVNWIEALPAEQITKFFANDPILSRVVADPRWETVLAQAQAYLHEDLPENVPAAAN
jgi:hypothetical protein